ncbi:MAG: hypothetical protein BWZ07_03067 [Alphaproteobacteria bacterium ADurb.BinA280]|nr:MAG: hypothetical protein BWZ07_03067 [Alphaproteobacteria bacterium ADurb.BinA280]
MVTFTSNEDNPLLAIDKNIVVYAGLQCCQGHRNPFRIPAVVERHFARICPSVARVIRRAFLQVIELGVQQGLPYQLLRTFIDHQSMDRNCNREQHNVSKQAEQQSPAQARSPNHRVVNRHGHPFLRFDSPFETQCGSISAGKAHQRCA